MKTFDINELEACFEQAAIKASFISLYQTLGLLTAVSSSPELIQPSEWIEQVQKDPSATPSFESKEQVEVFTTNLVAWWNYCITYFDHGHKLELPHKLGITEAGKANQALVDFATGYLEGYDWLSETWQALLPNVESEGARSLLVLNLILGRFVNEEAVEQTEPEIFSELPDIHGCFQTLPSLISAVGMLGHDLASEAEMNEPEMNEPDQAEPVSTFQYETKPVHRNDPCPCGSGKKFKKCCLH